MQVERYRIVLTGWVLSGYQTQDVIVELSRLFRVPEDMVRSLLVGVPSIIRRDLTQEKAERLRNKIEQRGAACSLKRVLRDESVDHLSGKDTTGIVEPDLSMEQSRLIPAEEQIAKSKIPGPVLPRRKGAESKRGGWGVKSVVLLLSILIAVMASDYFNWPGNGYSPNPSSKVFTYSPGKTDDFAGDRSESVRK